MNILIPLRSARAGRLRAREFAAHTLRNLLEFYLDVSLYSYGGPHLRGTYELRLWLRRRAKALLKRLPRRTRRPGLFKPEDLEALVQRQYGWRNASHTRREDRRHAAP